MLPALAFLTLIDMSALQTGDEVMSISVSADKALVSSPSSIRNLYLLSQHIQRIWNLSAGNFSHPDTRAHRGQTLISSDKAGFTIAVPLHPKDVGWGGGQFSA